MHGHADCIERPFSFYWVFNFHNQSYVYIISHFDEFVHRNKSLILNRLQNLKILGSKFHKSLILNNLDK